MRFIMKPALASVLLLASSIDAQLTDWPETQLNTSICHWDGLGAALVDGKVYLDGGSSYWTRGFDNGTYGGRPAPEPNAQGFILSYDLGNSFTWPSTNTTAILTKEMITKGLNSGPATGPGRNFRGGALLANDHQFYIYGGISLHEERLGEQPDKDEVLVYRSSQYKDSPKGRFVQGLEAVRLNNNVDRYIAYGGAANAPSENKAWYFSGLTSPDHEPIYSNFVNDSTKAGTVSNTLITLDMKYELTTNWSNDPIQSKDVKIKGRASPTLVWVPVNKRGILVALGGVLFPEWIENSRKSSNEGKSEKESPEFIQTIDIYDVESEKWYRQPTEGGPRGIRAKGCAVVAYASDHTSFNIYYYGGYDGLHPQEDFYDDVWVLSLPSFTWVLLNEGSPDHARAGHQCIKPYADQMMVFGGIPSTGTGCLEGGPILNFNLSSGEWKDSYDPADFDDYRVPKKVYDEIGGDAAGAATKTAPARWATSALADVFSSTYDYSKLTTYTAYPAVSTPTSRPDAPPPPEDKDDDGGSGLPSWLAPVLGVVLGLVLLAAVIVLFCLWRKRRFVFKKRGPSEPGTEDVGRMRIYNWVRGQQTPQPIEKAPTVTTSEEMPATASEMAHNYPAATYTVAPNRQDYNASPLGTPQEMYADPARTFELPDNSRAAELWGFTHEGINRSRSKRGAAAVQPQSWSEPSSRGGANSDFNDTVSQASGPIVEPGLVDSPTLAQSPAEAPEGKPRCTSDVSMITNHTSHMRNTSDATVSSEGTHAESRAVPERMSQPVVESIAERFEGHGPQPSSVPQADVTEGPVSPPTSDEVNATDYFPPLVSPIARPAVPNKDDHPEQK